MSDGLVTSEKWIWAVGEKSFDDTKALSGVSRLLMLQHVGRFQVDGVKNPSGTLVWGDSIVWWIDLQARSRAS